MKYSATSAAFTVAMPTGIFWADGGRAGDDFENRQCQQPPKYSHPTLCGGTEQKEAGIFVTI